jgi:polyisoprenoid-binding protein YceI
MKTTLTILLSVFTAIGAMVVDKKSVDVSKSSITWVGEKVTGKHTGTINLKEANLDFDGEALVGGMFVMDMTSINVTDLEGEYKGKLEGHLKSDDFFGVNNFATASYTITSVKDNGNGNYDITGDMVIKGISKSYTFKMEVVGNKAHVNAEIDRTDFDIRYGSTSFFDSLGDKAIYDDFTLDINLVF